MTGAAGKLQIRAAQNRPAPFPRAKLGAGGFPRGRHMKRDNRAVHSARPRISFPPPAQRETKQIRTHKRREQETMQNDENHLVGAGGAAV